MQAATMAQENKGEVDPEEEQEDEEEYPVPQCPLHEAVAVQPSPMGGRGLFALRDFAAGDGELRVVVRLWPWTSTPCLHCEESQSGASDNERGFSCMHAFPHASLRARTHPAFD